MNQDQQGGPAVQAIADWMRHVDQDGYYGGEPGAVHAQRDARALYRSVVAPLLADLEAARDNAITVGDRLGWRLLEAEQEIERLRREAEFWANGADTFSGADELAEDGSQCSVHGHSRECGDA